MVIKNTDKTTPKRCLNFDENDFSTLQIIQVKITGKTIDYNKNIEKLQLNQHPLMLQKTLKHFKRKLCRKN